MTLGELKETFCSRAKLPPRLAHSALGLCTSFCTAPSRYPRVEFCDEDVRGEAAPMPHVDSLRALFPVAFVPFSQLLVLSSNEGPPSIVFGEGTSRYFCLNFSFAVTQSWKGPTREVAGKTPNSCHFQ